MAIKNAAEYTSQLDKIAAEVESINPAVALQIDMISDVLEGKREASTLKFDADEAWYMQNRFNNNVQSRDTDEAYVDEFNKSNFEQVSDLHKAPVAVKTASVPYQKI